MCKYECVFVLNSKKSTIPFSGNGMLNTQTLNNTTDTQSNMHRTSKYTQNILAQIESLEIAHN